jgi:hypothetical protein
MTRYRRLILLALLLLTVLLTVELTGLREQFSLPALRALLEANLAVGLLLFVLAFVIGNLIQLPGWPFLAAAILALGTVVGGLVTYMAACVSCLVTFQVVKGLGGSALRDIDKPLAKKDSLPAGSPPGSQCGVAAATVPDHAGTELHPGPKWRKAPRLSAWHPAGPATSHIGLLLFLRPYCTGTAAGLTLTRDVAAADVNRPLIMS